MEFDMDVLVIKFCKSFWSFVIRLKFIVIDEYVN